MTPDHSDLNSLLNREISARDSAPPFLISLTREELAAHNVVLERRIEALDALAGELIDELDESQGYKDEYIAGLRRRVRAILTS